MKKTLVTALLGAALSMAATGDLMAQTTLRIFTGGQQRPDVMKQIVDVYMQRNPGVKVEVEVGGATSEQQQQYLNTVLASRDSTLDVVLIDVIRPAQWAAAQWAEPLDSYLGAEKDATMARYVAAYREANIVNGKVIALPYFADAQFLYYRKDLFEKHGVQPPKTWTELRDGLKKIMDAEKNPNLSGFQTAGAPIEGTVCTYLVPLWELGGQLTDASGKLTLTGETARKPFDLWGDLKSSGVLPSNIAEIVTDRMRQNYQAGNLISTMNWGYVWNRVENDADSVVKGKTGVVPMPAYEAGKSATCIGGWQLAVTAFSKNKAEAVKLVRFLSSPEVSKMQAILASHMPVFPEVYTDPEVLKANPWFKDALPVVQTARSRPVTPRYNEVSEIIRTNMNAFLAGTKTADAALSDMQSRLTPIFK
ncbi:ABC transporter substrate-binding protein [Alsobacter sp. SYSU M60028]|uniref:ABC transporter substrate-binding protein n=1 Tax=Alsobacter ponti TaxID=2962936 RepID=A0ABT1L880_9HYPH|nr:ABC transporter substrate-binding protein [Alsobacter ponti]MCP8937712.1 ABC transporter substrate-binding protein [Alsobacter ponti]